MQTVIESLEALERSYRQSSEDEDLTAIQSRKQFLIAEEYTKALSILRSYPQSGDDEAEPAEPLPHFPTGKLWTAVQYAGDDPIALESTPPKMQDDPRYLAVLCFGYHSLLRGLSTEENIETVQQNAISIFNTLFLKP